MKKIISIGFILWALVLSAQQEIENVISPSPTMAGLGKYGSYPVSYYTGTPNIDIPLHAMKTGNYNLPISLSYHASGIRVDDIASWVGLGWSLNAGGIIQVNVKGHEDIQYERRSDPLTIDEILDPSLVNAIPYAEYLDQLVENFYESEAQPDIYCYNFAGYSGKFIFDENGQAHFFSNHNGLKIDMIRKSDVNAPHIYSAEFIITDNGGNKYYFSTYETTKNQPAKYGLNDVNGKGVFALVTTEHTTENITGYFLDSIKLANSIDAIYFQYRDETIIHHSRINGNFLSDDTRVRWEINSGYSHGSEVTNSTKRVQRIYDTRGNNIEFNEDFVQRNLPSREDLTVTNYPLHDIRVYYNDLLKKEWKFEYDKFISNAQINLDYVSTNYKNHIRLKLTGIKKTINYNQQIEYDSPYIFNYYGDDDTNLRLPPRNSYYGIDAWGFCNTSVLSSDQDKVTDAYKSFPLINSGNNNFSTEYLDARIAYYSNNFKRSENWVVPYFEDGSNKEANGNYSKAFSLKKILYPTKGTTEFAYEGHKNLQINFFTGGNSNACGGIRIASIIENPNDNSSATLVRNFLYEDGRTVGQPQYSTIKINIDHSTSTPQNAYLYNNAQGIMSLYDGEHVGYKKVTMETNAGSEIYYFYSFFDLNIEEYAFDDFKSVITAVFQKWTLNGSVCVPTGEYEFVSHEVFNLYQESALPFQETNWMRFVGKGLLHQKEIKNTNGDLIQKEIHKYKFVEENKIHANKALHANFTPGVDWTWENCFLNSYYIQTGKSFLDSKETINYFYDELGNQSTTSSIANYIYNETYELISEENVENSKGEIIKTVYRYPFDIDLNDYNASEELLALIDMNSKNIVNKPVEIINYADTKVVGGTYYEYKKETSNLIVVNKIHKLETNQPLVEDPVSSSTTFKPCYLDYDGTGYFITKDNYYEPDLLLGNYDDYGNILQYKKENGDDVTYFWGYNTTYPIAKISNASHNEVAYTSFEFGSSNENNFKWSNSIFHEDAVTGAKSLEPLSGTLIETKEVIPAGTYKLSMWAKRVNGSTGGAITVSGQSIEPFWPGDEWNYNERTITLSSDQKVIIDATDNILIDELRLYPIDAQITTYTYDPLIGMTTETDTNGKTTYYEYDSFGRLICIKDHKGNILKQYNYNYATQNP